MLYNMVKFKSKTDDKKGFEIWSWLLTEHVVSSKISIWAKPLFRCLTLKLKEQQQQRPNNERQPSANRHPLYTVYGNNQLHKDKWYKGGQYIH